MIVFFSFFRSFFLFLSVQNIEVALIGTKSKKDIYGATTHLGEYELGRFFIILFMSNCFS